MGIVSGLLAAFVSGLAWAGLDALRKTLASREPPVVVAAGLSLGGAVLFGGALAFAPVRPDPGYALPAGVSFALGLAVQLLILESVRRGDLSRTIPLLSLTPVFTAVTGWWILDEALTAREWGGVASIVVGALLLAPFSWRGSRERSSSGEAIMLAAAACIALGAPFDKRAVASSSPVFHGLLHSLVSLVVLAVWLARSNRLRRVGRLFASGPAMTVAVLLFFFALFAQLLAYRSVMVGIVESIKRVLGLVAALLVGRLAFGEPLSVRSVVAVALMSGGVVLLLV